MLTGFAKARRDVVNRRLRSALTLLGIVIAVGGVVTIISTSRNLAAAQANAYNHATQADVRIATWEAPDSLRPHLLAIPNVAAVELRTTYTTKWRFQGEWRDVLLVALADFGNVQVDQVELRAGAFPAHHEVTFERSVLDVAPLQIGDDVVYRSGQAGQSRREQLVTVAGFASSPSYPSASVTGLAVAYVPLADLRAALGTQGSSETLLRLVRFADRDETVAEVKRLLARRGLPVHGTTIRDPDNYPGKRELDTLIALMLLFSAIGLIISGFLVANTLSAIIGEQINEIGIMKAIGATRGQVLRLYLLLSLLYGTVGTILGCAVGVGGGFGLQLYLARLMNLDLLFAVDPPALAAGAAVGVGATLVSSLLPTWRGAGITVKAAFDSYGIQSSYGQGWLDRLLVRLRRLPPLLALGLRNLVRRKLRSAFTLGAIGLSAAAFLAAWTTNSSVNVSVDHLYDTYDADGFVFFREPVAPSMAGALRAVDGVRRVEYWVNGSATVGQTRTRLRAVPADTELYRKRLVDGRWFAAEERDAVVLSNEIAARAGVGVGDAVTVETDRRRERLRVVGLVLDSSTRVGSTSTGNVFVSEPTFRRLNDYQPSTGYFAFTLWQPAEFRAIAAEIERIHRGLNPVVYAMREDREQNKKLTAILTAMLIGMVIVVATVGGIGVLNTLTLNVLERRREIGIMRSVGAVDRHLVVVFLSEGLLLGLGGAVVGLALGFPLAQLLTGTISAILFQIEFIFEPVSVLGMLGFAVLLSGLFSLLPALGAARLPAGQALRYE